MVRSHLLGKMSVRKIGRGAGEEWVDWRRLGEMSNCDAELTHAGESHLHAYGLLLALSMAQEKTCFPGLW